MTEITETRFKLPSARNTAYENLSSSDLQSSIAAETSGGVEFSTVTTPPEGPALADIIIVALIAGGSTVTAAAIAAYGSYLINRQKKPDSKDTPPPTIAIRIRGIMGSETVQLSTDQEANKRAIKAAVKRLKIITSVAVAD